MSKSPRCERSDAQFSKKHVAAAVQYKTTNQVRHLEKSLNVVQICASPYEKFWKMFVKSEVRNSARNTWQLSKKTTKL